MPLHPEQKKKINHLGELNHKGIGLNREAKQQGKPPFPTDACESVTTSTHSGKAGLGWIERAQAGATIHPPAARNIDHLVLG